VAGTIDVVHFGQRHVHEAGLVHPPFDVSAAIGAGHADVFTCGQRDLATRALQLTGELHAGGRCTNDEHIAVRELLRVAIRKGCQRGDVI